ncbi:hypothetical protein Baya_14458 [Bagarius yarrelli]|uniref:Uncharacterized protein n=1 Tax=Bagarius yarrelli TaxID=175774 RepID=A0A556V8M2_BAGYA|nr:hypothetical protein Baya_14458 [Bagarius yarrelli]
MQEEEEETEEEEGKEEEEEEEEELMNSDMRVEGRTVILETSHFPKLHRLLIGEVKRLKERGVQTLSLRPM